MSEINWLEMFGYLASVITGISLTMSSIVKLRWLNLLGSFCFGTYGILISATPVALLNYFICAANIYYLWKIYTEKTHFQMLETSTDDIYLKEFLKLHQKEILTFFPSFELLPDRQYTAMMIHRNLSLAGVFIGQKVDGSTMEVALDFVLPEYRDLKPGQFIFQSNTEFFKKLGVQRLLSAAGSEAHIGYLKQIGFKTAGDKLEYPIPR